MNEAERILHEQELKELKLRRLQTLQAAAKWREDHKLEVIAPHAQQQRLIDAYQSGKHSIHAVLGGNRSGKSFIGAALTVAIALGRLPWVPLPTPHPLPAPYGVTVRGDGQVGIIFPQPVIDALPESEPKDLWLPHVTERPDAAFTIKSPTKSTQLAIRMFESDKAYRAWRQSVEAPPDPGQLRFKPPVKIRVFGEDAKALEQVQIPLIKSLIAPEWVAATKKNSFGLDGHWVLMNGSTIDFFTYQQEPATFEGWHGHHLWFDEPPPRPVYIANLRGLVDYRGTALFTMTPLSQVWIADEVVNKPDPNIFSLVMNSRENPHVSKEAIDQFEEALTEDERETRIGGKFLHLQGLVFKDFNPQTHVVDPFVPDRQYTVYVSIDTHPRTEQCIIFAATDRKENVFVFHEIFKHDTPEQVGGWIADFHRNVHPIQLALIDPSSQGDANRGDSTYDLICRALHAEGIPLDFGSKDLMGGIQIMQTFIKSRNGLASLFVTRDCERFLYEINRYVWANHRGNTAQARHQLNKPVDAADHTLECTRRILQLPPRWYPPSGTASQTQGFIPLDPQAGY